MSRASFTTSTKVYKNPLYPLHATISKVDLTSKSPSGNYHWTLWLLTALSCISGFLFGYDTSVIAGALLLLKDEFDLSDLQQELVVSMTVFGALIASLAVGGISDLIGRKMIVLASSLIFAVGSILLAFSSTYVMLLSGRFIVGVAVGATSGLIPVYVSEISPKQSRGFLVTCINCSITFGQFFSSCIDASFVNLSNGWRYMFAFGAFPAILQFIGFINLPESPRFLIENDYVDDAIIVMQKLRNTIHVNEEIDEIITSVMEHRSISLQTNLPTWRQLIQSNLRRSLLLGCMLQAAQQICGINTVMYYSSTILKLAGFVSNVQILWLSAVVSFCNFIGSCIGLFLVDRIGRRKLTLTSLFLVFLTLGLIALCFYIVEIKTPKATYTSSASTCSSLNYCFDCVQSSDCGFCSSIPASAINPNDLSLAFFQGCLDASDSSPLEISQCPNLNDFYTTTCPDTSKMYSYLILGSLCLYLLCFAPGIGTMPWMITSEIYPTHIRGICNSITTSVNWSANLLMSLTFLTIVKLLGKMGAFGLYSLLALLFFLFMFYFLPETKDLSLEDIQRLFEDKKEISLMESKDKTMGPLEAPLLNEQQHQQQHQYQQYHEYQYNTPIAKKKKANMKAMDNDNDNDNDRYSNIDVSIVSTTTLQSSPIPSHDNTNLWKVYNVPTPSSVRPNNNNNNNNNNNR